MKPFTLLAAAAMALAPAAALAIAPPAGTYVTKAGASDLFEITEAKMMVDSKNPQVQQFAQQMITDHTNSTNEVMAAAKADGLNPSPPVMTPKQKAMVDALKHDTGAHRDMAYKKQQITAHEQAIAMQKEYAASGDKPNLKATAQKIVPVIEGHLQMAKALSPAKM